MTEATAAALRAGLYVHVPFCSAVCPYCDFAVRRDAPELHDRWVDGVLREARDFGARHGLVFDTVYLGGGTPSALAPARLERLLAGLHEHLAVATAAVLHLEANPEDVEASTLAAWRDLGAAFLSLGVQSFEDTELRFLGRRHDGARARAALAAALESGIPTVSADLIFGLPDQNARSWRRNLEQVVAASPQHVSCYQLTVKEGTPFHRRVAAGRWRELENEVQADLLALTHRMLGDHGWSAYEVSNFARSPAHRSRHNLGYWRREPFLGLGPGAHSFDGVVRWWNPRDLGAWLQKVELGRDPREEEERPSAAQAVLERLMLGLRSDEGVALSGLGWDLATARASLLRRWQEEGLLRLDEGTLRATSAGWAIADALARDLAPDDDVSDIL